MLLRTMTGSENWRGHSAKYHVFHTPTTGGREVHIGVASRDPSSPVTVTRQGQAHAAKPGYNPETGSWTDATYDVPAGECLKLFAIKAGGFGAMQLQANLFIQMREEAALHRVKLYLSQDPNARYSVVYVEGRFDILTFDQAKVIGVKVLPQFRKFSEPEIVNRIFVVDVVEPQVRPRQVMERRTVQVAGVEAPVAIAMRRRSRAMQL